MYNSYNNTVDQCRSVYTQHSTYLLSQPVYNCINNPKTYIVLCQLFDTSVISPVLQTVTTPAVRICVTPISNYTCVTNNTYTLMYELNSLEYGKYYIDCVVSINSENALNTSEVNIKDYVLKSIGNSISISNTAKVHDINNNVHKLFPPSVNIFDYYHYQILNMNGDVIPDKLPSEYSIVVISSRSFKIDNHRSKRLWDKQDAYYQDPYTLDPIDKPSINYVNSDTEDYPDDPVDNSDDNDIVNTPNQHPCVSQPYKPQLTICAISTFEIPKLVHKHRPTQTKTMTPTQITPSNNQQSIITKITSVIPSTTYIRKIIPAFK